jgi:hypothetical protein
LASAPANALDIDAVEKGEIATGTKSPNRE